MPQYFNQDIILHGLLDERFISFNIRRSPKNHSPFPRKVTLLQPSQLKKTVIPGIMKNKERPLSEELKRYQNWKTVKNHSFEIPPYIFSFMWRFRTDENLGLDKFRSLVPIDKKMSKKIKAAFKKYRAHLQSNLKAGQVYLIPDAEMTFNRRNRFKQVYARRILVIDVRSEQLLMIPFSGQTGRMNRKTDILFDNKYKGKCLDPDAYPAVESYPYKIFIRKVALCVCAAQPITEESFLDAALISMGPVRKELVNFVKEKLKKI